MDCEHVRELLIMRLDEPLDGAAALQLGEHLAACDECRLAADEIAGLDRRLSAAAQRNRPPAVDPAIMDHIHQRKQQLNWRQRMFRHSRRIGFGVAGGLAAAIALAAFLLPTGGGSGGGGVAYADVMNHFRSARTLIMNCQELIDNQPAGEHRFEVADDRYVRMTTAGRVLVADLETMQAMSLNEQTKTACVFEPGHGKVDFYNEFRSLIDESAESLGVQDLDGRPAAAFRVNSKHFGEATVWADVSTGVPIRIETRSPHGGGAHQQSVLMRADLQFDVPIDASRFELTAPPGYSVLHKMDAQFGRKHMAHAIRKILMACQMYQDEKGAWPESLDQLAVYGINSIVLRSPIHPELDVGYVYVRPPQPADPARAVLFERLDSWDGSACVGFADGHVEIVNDEPRFNELLGAAQGE